MKVTIEREGCTLCAVCWETCPEVFEEDPGDGMSQIVKKYRVNNQIDQAEVPDSLSDCVTSAAESCPVDIIHIEES